LTDMLYLEIVPGAWRPERILTMDNKKQTFRTDNDSVGQVRFDNDFFCSWFDGKLPRAIPTTRPGFWAKTIELWHSQGHLAVGEDPCDKVGLDVQLAEDHTCPMFLGMDPAFDIEILEQDENYVTFRDDTDILQKMHSKDFDRTKGLFENAGMAEGMSHWLEHPVKDIASWKAIYEKRFRPNMEERLSKRWRKKLEGLNGNADAAFLKGEINNFPFFGTFGMLRHLVGAEPLMYMFYENPSLIRTILSDMLEFWMTLWGSFFDKYGNVIGRVHFFEDMCYKGGPFISPDTFNEFLAPVYTELIGFFKGNGVTVFSVDSDGNAMIIIPELLKCGVNMFMPLEVQCGMDAAACRDAFGELFLYGGMDKRVLNQGTSEIDEELNRCFTTAYKKGRYWPAFDHSIPPIPWENWIYFTRRYKQYSASSALVNKQ